MEDLRQVDGCLEARELVFEGVIVDPQSAQATGGGERDSGPGDGG